MFTLANNRIDCSHPIAEQFSAPGKLITRKFSEMIDRSKGCLDDLESIGYGADATQQLHSEISSRMDTLAPTRSRSPALGVEEFLEVALRLVLRANPFENCGEQFGLSSTVRERTDAVE